MKIMLKKVIISMLVLSMLVPGQVFAQEETSAEDSVYTETSEEQNPSEIQKGTESDSENDQDNDEIKEDSGKIPEKRPEEFSEELPGEEIPEPIVLAQPQWKQGTVQEGIIQVEWDAVENAQGYYVYRKISGKSWEKSAVIENVEETAYTDIDVSSGITYYYKIKAYCDEGQNISIASENKKMVYLGLTKIAIQTATNGNRVKWTKTTGSAGYYVYRKTGTEREWKQVAQLPGGNVLEWVDNSVSNGKVYNYCVKAYNGESLSPYLEEKSIMRVSAPKIKSWKRKSSTKMYLSWYKVSGTSGYEIQYSSSRLFSTKKTVKITSDKTVSKTIGSLKRNKTYYVRIRAYKTVNGKNYYSPWTAYSSIYKNKTMSVSILKKRKAVYELRAQTKQALYQYDTVQGGCTDGKYAYYLMYNRDIQMCKIAKIRLSDLKVIKVSESMELDHGNDMTYNPDKKCLVIVHASGSPKKLSTVNTQSLTIKAEKNVKIPSALAGASEADIKAAKGFSAIAYNSKRKQYVVQIGKTEDILVLNDSMDPVSYIKLSKKDGYTIQGMDATDEYILIGQSPKVGTKQTYNIITVYNWEGKYISRLYLKKGYELENIYHVGSQFYATFYTSYYKTYYKKEKKTVIVKGKKKKKTVKVKYKKFKRDNYIYKIGAF